MNPKCVAMEFVAWPDLLQRRTNKAPGSTRCRQAQVHMSALHALSLLGFCNMLFCKLMAIWQNLLVAKIALMHSPPHVICDAGLIQPELLPDGQVCVDMGEPILEAQHIPTTLQPSQASCKCMYQQSLDRPHLTHVSVDLVDATNDSPSMSDHLKPGTMDWFQAVALLCRSPVSALQAVDSVSHCVYCVVTFSRAPD